MPERLELLNEDGEAVLHYTLAMQERLTAQGAVARAGVGAAVEAVLAQLSGWWLTSSDSELIDGLQAVGATPVRHAHLYSRPLLSTSSLPEPVLARGFAFGPLDRSPLDLGSLAVLAYPPSHPDFETADPVVASAEFVGLFEGSLVGPLLKKASGVILHGDRLVAACVINRASGAPPEGGPWVSDVFRDPDPAFAGLGTLLLQRSLARLTGAGETSVGLAVTDGNPAEAVYRRLGFEHRSSSYRLAIP